MDTPVDIPETDIPEEKKVSDINGRKNFADNKRTVGKVLERAKDALKKYQSQQKRMEYETVMDEADEMLRMAADQTKQAENKTSDDMDTIPDIFYRVHRAITANEAEIIVKPVDPPGMYEPLEHLDEITREYTLKNCEKQALILEYSRMMDNRKDKEEDVFWTVNKYGNVVLGMEWYQREWETEERKPAPNQSADTPEDQIVYTWQKTKQVEAYPAMVKYDMGNAWFDAMIDGFQGQSTFMFQSFPMLEDVYAKQMAGDYMNAKKIDQSHFFKQSQPDNVKTDRADNAGDGGDENVMTGQLDEWHVWMRAPIDEETGKWNEKKTRARWWLATFEGSLDHCSEPVCVRLIRNPYWWNEDRVPYLLMHSHRDDNGAFHAGYAKQLRPAYNELKTTLDQWFYNKNLQNAAPWIMEHGALYNDAKSFGPHSLVVTHQGMLERIKKLEVPSITQDMQAFIAYLENRFQQTAGTNDAYMGEAMGGRTSATEADRAYNQARKPGIAALRYKASQLYPWMAEWDAAMWRHYADPDLTIALTRDGSIEELKPATVWGNMRYKVVAIDEYERTAVARHEDDRFLQTTLPIYMQAAGPRMGMKMLGYIYKRRDYPAELFPDSSDKDARHVARNENEKFVAKVWIEPLEGQDHDIHLDEHQTFLIVYKALVDKDPQVVEILQAHVAMTEAMKQRQAQGIAEAGKQMQARTAGGGIGEAPAAGVTGMGETPPANVGEVNGNMLGAAGGGMMA